MQLDYFLTERVEFTKYFFQTATKPFLDTITLIENEQPPYVPIYDESGEPQFLEEWLNATTAYESIGISAVSMLASSLQLFLREWVDRFDLDRKKYKRKHKKGWFFAYRKALEEIVNVFSECPADLDLIEQAVLVRNRGQHPESLTSLNCSHSESDLSKYPSPFFVSSTDAAKLDTDEETSWWLLPNIYVDSHKFECICQEIEKLCCWLESLYDEYIQR